jgi:hypothetical protein
LDREAVALLPTRQTLALLDPGLGIVNLTGLTGGESTGGNLPGGASLLSGDLPVSVPSL